MESELERNSLHIVFLCNNDLFEHLGKEEGSFTENDILRIVEQLNLQKHQLSSELARIVHNAKQNIYMLKNFAFK